MRLFLMAAASLYIVSPIDAIPELVPGSSSVSSTTPSWSRGSPARCCSETERFLEWEKAQGRGPSVMTGEALQPLTSARLARCDMSTTSSN